MPYQIYFRKDHNCVFLVHTGEMDIEQARLARNELRDALTAHNCNKVLIEETQANKKLSAIDEHQFTAEYGSELTRSTRIAIIVRREKMSEARFVENVAFNRGIQLRIFHNRKEALDWLSGYKSSTEQDTSSRAQKHL